MFFTVLSFAGKQLLEHVEPGAEEDCDSTTSTPSLASKTVVGGDHIMMDPSNQSKMVEEGATEGTEEDGGPMHVVHVVDGHYPSDRDHAVVPV
jgi:hypothetical protein